MASPPRRSRWRARSGPAPSCRGSRSRRRPAPRTPTAWSCSASSHDAPTYAPGVTAGLVNSADSHVVEPLDLWVLRLPVSLRDRAPRIADVDGEPRLLVEGMVPRRMGGGGNTDAEQRDRERAGDGRFRAGGWDPDQRIVDLDEDGVWGEVLYPTIALFAFMIPDPELRWASARAYNDWLAETFAAQSQRFAGAAMIPVQEIEPAVAEIERIADLGLRSI